MRRRLAIMAALIAAFPMQGALAATQCPGDSVIFRDMEKGLAFGVERVAVSYAYLCGDKAVRSTRPRSDLRDCRGPFGDTVFEGFLNGQKVYAVRTVIAGAPCCSWDSFSANSAVAKKPWSWLPAGQAPKIQLGDEWMTISGDETSPLTGPLGGGKFVPSMCRSYSRH